MWKPGLLAAILPALATGGPSLAEPATAPPAASDVPHCPAPPPTSTEDQRPAPLGPPPSLPSCIDPQTHVGHCAKGVVDRYNAAINIYNAQVVAHSSAVQRYVDTLNDWSRAVRDYGNCEINILNAELH